MIRSHSATGSLHGVQLNPIAADILRKEPEHETFSRINITAVGMFFLLISFYSVILANVEFLRSVKNLGLSNITVQFMGPFLFSVCTCIWT
jgi:hypothetical protein